MLVALHLGIVWQLVPGVVAVDANGLLELGLEVAALARVGLTVVAPLRTLAHADWVRKLSLVGVLRVGLPVLSGVA